MSNQRSPDLRLAALAGRQHGVVAHAQLIKLGLPNHAIFERARRGRLHRIHRGVYAVGHRSLTRDAGWMAAVLAGAPGAVLRHHSAALLWRLRDRGPSGIDVTAPGRRRPRQGIRFHRTRLPPDEVTVHHGIPVTTVPRTLLDQAASLTTRGLERAINEADALGLTDPLSLPDLLARHPRTAGAAAARHALRARASGDTVTRSKLEERFLALLRRHPDLPWPSFNKHVGEYEVDLQWPDRRLAAELDGRATHLTPLAFETDRERDRRLAVAGWRVVRITWRQVTETPAALIADLRALLAA
jgi:very-short-patch-repair endonuclease